MLRFKPGHGEIRVFPLQLMPSRENSMPPELFPVACHFGKICMKEEGVRQPPQLRA
jgi:hypothetical protein